MKVKYIVFRAGIDELMVTFPEVLAHRQVSAKLFDLVGLWDTPVSLVSAGFIEAGKCCGDSESLKLESRPGIDQVLLEGGLFGAVRKVAAR